MKSLLFRKHYSMLFVFCCLFIFSHTVFADETYWKPVTPAELQIKTPQVEPDADAEAIFWEVRLDNKKANRLSYKHYVRVKIFTERGREKFSKFDIPFLKGKKVEDVAARVIKPDGTIIPLLQSDIFEREIVTLRKIKIKAKSFAVPGIEPGVIVEYQYREIFKNDSAGGERMIFQRDIPLQKVTYYVRPYENMTLIPKFYNMPEARFVKAPTEEGFSMITVDNVPALKEEPYMPPDDEVRRWGYLSYQSFDSLFQWSRVSQYYGSFLTEIFKPNKEIEQKAVEITSGAVTQEDKLRKIYDFVQKNIRNITFDPRLTDDQRESVQFKEIVQVLRMRTGNVQLIDLLFAALAKSYGFEVNLLLTGDRSENFFTPEKYNNPGFINPAGIAVKVDKEWKFFNPGLPFLPYGKMVWYEENLNSMLVGENGYIWKQTPLSDISTTVVRRNAKFKLTGEGALEGTVKFLYAGHMAINRRREVYMSSPEKREEAFKEEIKKNISAAEISEFAIENFEDNEKPLTYSFKIKVPNYAQKTGKRLFVQPGFFEYGSTPVFSSSTRTNDIYFPYPWSEKDYVEIELPTGFSLDNADAPGDVGDPAKIGQLKIAMSLDNAKNTLKYQRTFHFGGGGNILFPASSYQPLKSLFDSFHKADTHTITLKSSSPETKQ
ncbi:MAG: DUF3857 and transglutaminase domain-containing protein [Pyrinomonadaceae bacterium]|nr:DUF3857 and transglutaminase domain-containing protein [Pyrinomonadaceae bacterium]